MNQSEERPYTQIYGRAFMFNNGNGETILAGFSENTLIIGSDQDTTLIGFGRYDIDAFFGDGRNVAFGAAGNDVFGGGAGSNMFFGGGGNDVLVGGEGYNNLNGGAGDDTIMFGQWDQVSGGWGADHFVLAMKTTSPVGGYTFVRDLSFKAGDTLDLTAIPGVTRASLAVQGDDLTCYTPDGGVLNIGGVGHQLILVGGIDAAIDAGYLSVFGDFGGKG